MPQTKTKVYGSGSRKAVMEKNGWVKMRLKYGGRCGCGRFYAKGDYGWWNPSSKVINCQECGPQRHRPKMHYTEIE